VTDNLFVALVDAIRRAPWDTLPALALADWLDEHGDPRAGRVRELAVLDAKKITVTVYRKRKARQSEPEGRWDGAGRWWPSDREDADGDLTRRVRSPSRKWGCSYIKAARSRRHCAALVAQALAGEDAPPDVTVALRGPLLAVLDPGVAL
jgi:uncharacterized protein (TIGR02996 family)